MAPAAPAIAMAGLWLLAPHPALSPVGRGGSGRQRIADGQGEARRDGHGTVRHVDGDAPGVGHAPLGAEITRRHHRGEAPLPGAFLQPPQPLVDDQLGRDLGPRRDVADLLREEARAILLEQPRRVALGEGLLEPLASGREAVHLADDPALADPEGIAGHRGVRGQRHLVRHAQRVGIRILEPLLQHDAGEAARGIAPQRDAPQGQTPPIDAHQPAPGTVPFAHHPGTRRSIAHGRPP